MAETLKWNPDEQIACDGCGFQPEPLLGEGLKAYGMNRFIPGDFERFKWLCELCAGTFAGNAVEYPEQYPQKVLMFQINYVGNVLLREMRKRNG